MLPAKQQQATRNLEKGLSGTSLFSKKSRLSSKVFSLANHFICNKFLLLERLTVLINHDLLVFLSWDLAMKFTKEYQKHMIKKFHATLCSLQGLGDERDVAVPGG
jgi:hypothetical protein